MNYRAEKYEIEALEDTIKVEIEIVEPAIVRPDYSSISVALRAKAYDQLDMSIKAA
jgi:hypothetical protein